MPLTSAHTRTALIVLIALNMFYTPNDQAVRAKRFLRSSEQAPCYVFYSYCIFMSLKRCSRLYADGSVPAISSVLALSQTRLLLFGCPSAM